MKITFHGAARTVTGSRHLLEVNGQRILLDCGLYQGPRRKTYKRNLNFPFSPQGLQAVILSHAHIDHSGNLPNLVRQGFQGPIYATRATAHLAEIMLRDSGHIHESDAEFVNKKRKRRGEPPVEPLYTVEDAERVKEFLVGQPYDQHFEPATGVVARLVEAGHILGSAAIVLDLEEAGKKVRLMFSGDIGRPGMPIMRDPVFPEDVDYLLLECTYGDRDHHHPAQAAEELEGIVGRTVDRGGKVIIPSFAVGRTQTLVYYLHLMIDRGVISSIPVFVDSPLAINVTDIFRAHPECFDRATLKFLESDPHGTVFGFDHLTYTRSVEASKAINHVDGPAVIISASGMAEVGRILHHLRNNIHDARNTVLITSWMAPHTLGRRLVEGEKEVRIFGEVHQVNAQVASINGLSAHADQEYLLHYAGATKASLRRTFLVHGEDDAAEALQAKLREKGIEDVIYPELNQSFEL
jgi:metallo-beta-lactamase family protein